LPERTPYYLKVEYYNKILCDFEKQERFGKLMLLDVDDHPLLQHKGQEEVFNSIFLEVDLADQKLAEQETEAKVEDGSQSPKREVKKENDYVQLVSRLQKIQRVLFEEIDMDRLDHDESQDDHTI
jgi:hypothetical protein